MDLTITKDDKIALLFGATGLTGSHCLNFLLDSKAYTRVVVFGRRPLIGEHPKLVYHKVDFDNPSSFAHLIKGDDLFSCLGTTIAKAGSKEAFMKVDYHYAYNIALAARENGVQQYLLVSALGANPDSLFFYNRVKGQLEEAVRGLGFWATHIFRPSVLLGERREMRMGEKMAGKIGTFVDNLAPGLLSKYTPIKGEVVAKAMVAAAQKLEGGWHIYASDHIAKMT